MSSIPRHAFTLVELLVVIAIIGVLSGSIGFALRSGGRAPALQAAQASLAGLVSSARAQAALTSADSTLIIWADRGVHETYLRRAAIAQKVDEDSDGDADFYTIKGEVVDLPRGIFFVPADSGAALPAKLETPSLWNNLTLTESQANNGTRSKATFGFRRYDEDNATNPWVTDPAAPSTYYESIGFDSYGKLNSVKDNDSDDTVSYLAVAPGEVESGPTDSERGVLFQTPEALRGLKLSAYGIPMLLNEKNAFKP